MVQVLPNEKEKTSIWKRKIKDDKIHSNIYTYFHLKRGLGFFLFFSEFIKFLKFCFSSYH